VSTQYSIPYSIPDLTNDDSSDLATILEILPRVIQKLSVEGFDKSILHFIKLVDEDKFPLTNIALILWTEVVKWYGCTLTSQMRYSKETKMFWKLGYRIFGGKFANFMSGFKCGPRSQSSDFKGCMPPTLGEINFAVPDL
jgi:hypothetical protein